MTNINVITVTGFEDATFPSRFGEVQAEQMKIVFRDRHFFEMELSGHLVGHPGVGVTASYPKASKVPTWALPWTVYGAAEIGAPG